jgi:hypothetical protein
LIVIPQASKPAHILSRRRQFVLAGFEQAKRENAGKPRVSLEEMMTKFGITPEDAA